MNIGPAEILVILVFALLVVGPERLPKFGSSLGKGINRFKSAQDKVEDTLKKEGLDPQSIREASANPFLALEKIDDIGKKTGFFPGEDSAEAAGESGEDAASASGDGDSSSRGGEDASR